MTYNIFAELLGAAISSSPLEADSDSSNLLPSHAVGRTGLESAIPELKSPFAYR